MGYCLINGKRYYRDDQTGRLTVDNVSQQEADRRMNRTENRSVSRGTAVRSGSMAASQNSRGTVRMLRLPDGGAGEFRGLDPGSGGDSVGYRGVCL